MPKKTYTLTVLDWRSHQVTGRHVTRIGYTETVPSFWPWGKSTTHKRTAIRKNYAVFFQDEDTGELIPQTVQNLVSVWEAKNNAS